MNDRLEDLYYQSGITAQGCWDHMDDYDRKAVEKLVQLIIQDCAASVKDYYQEDQFNCVNAGQRILEHFGFEQ